MKPSPSSALQEEPMSTKADQPCPGTTRRPGVLRNRMNLGVSVSGLLPSKSTLKKNYPKLIKVSSATNSRRDKGAAPAGIFMGDFRHPSLGGD